VGLTHFISGFEPCRLALVSHNEPQQSPAKQESTGWMVSPYHEQQPSPRLIHEPHRQPRHEHLHVRMRVITACQNRHPGPCSRRQPPALRLDGVLPPASSLPLLSWLALFESFFGGSCTYLALGRAHHGQTTSPVRSARHPSLQSRTGKGVIDLSADKHCLQSGRTRTKENRLRVDWGQNLVGNC
jgi:hypothetical protein